MNVCLVNIGSEHLRRQVNDHQQLFSCVLSHFERWTQQTSLKVQNRKFSVLVKRQRDLSEPVSALLSSFLTARLMAYLLHSFFMSRLLCGLITTIALLWYSRIIMSFIVLIRVSVSPDLCYVFTVPTGKYMRAAPAPDRWIQTHCR